MDDFTTLMKKQLVRGTYITNFRKNTDKRGSQHTAQFIKQRIDLLKSYWEDFYRADMELASPPEDFVKHSYYDHEAIDVPLDYSLAKAWLEEKLLELKGPLHTPISPTVAPPSNSKMHFEKIKLPRFDGTQRDWDSFKDQFAALIIQDVTIPTVVKFHHLINCLHGEAANHLKGYEVVGNKFTAAWHYLCDTYDNRFLRCNAHMDAIFQLPVASKETASHLTQVITTTLESMSAFKALELPVEHWDVLLTYILRTKLAPETRKEWFKSFDSKPRSKGFPSFEDFKEFLQKRIREVAMANSSLSTVSTTPSTLSAKNKGKGLASSAIHMLQPSTHAKTKPIRQCSYCAKNHTISYCETFITLPVEERRSFVKTHNLCFNCMSAAHRLADCKVRFRCIICGQQHHSRLHLEHGAKVESSTTVALTSLSHTSSTGKISGRGILTTALVLLENELDQRMTARALLDTGAEDSIISEHVVQFLQLPKVKGHAVISGAGGASNAVSTYRTSVLLKSPVTADFAMQIQPLVLKRVSALIPYAENHNGEWTHLKDLQLADPFFNVPSRVDCVLSSTVFGQVILDGVRRDPIDRSLPVALNTLFGWVLMGSTFQSKGQSHSSTFLSINAELSRAVERLWEVEEIPQALKLSPAEKQCVDHFNSTHYRDEEGRFVVRLPFSRTPSLFGTQQVALQCFQRLEKRLKRDKELSQHYEQFLQEYESLGHLSTVSEINEGVYLPHHPVWKTGDHKKIRVVFNASQPDRVGNSLNSFLHAGPKLHLDITTVLCRWAFYRYVFTCDIIKMFRQFRVDPADWKWQRILWRVDPAMPIRHLSLCTVTDGTTCAPFLANACLNALTDSSNEDYLAAVDVIKHHRYVDDFFGGANTIDDSEATRANLLSLLDTAGLKTDKLKMNYGDSSAERFINLAINDPSSEGPVSLLGLAWDPKNDMYSYKFQPTPIGKISKRTILSTTARLYDPMGWISPIVLRAKLIIQALWIHGADWDAPVSALIESTWTQFFNSLPDVSSIRIPRWVNTVPNCYWEIHGFADASQKAYAAVVYVITDRAEGRAITLLTAKSKIAPVKTLQVPRLELCAAHLLAKLLRRLQDEFKEQPHLITCWSDSKNVLTWLANHPARWQTFIANRVSEIRTFLPEAPWRYVPTEDNPADIASRGCSPAELKDSVLWWKGPTWLQHGPEAWPTLSNSPIVTHEERKKSSTTIFVFMSIEDGEFIQWIERFSSADKIIAIWAYCLRWFHRVQNETVLRRHYLTAEELLISRLHVIHHLQRSYFSKETQCLQANQPVPTSSPLHRLCPYLDEYGVMRVGGRLQYSLLSEDAKHPAILAPTNHFTILLIRRAHKLTLHGGLSVVLGFLSQQYWIEKGRNAVRKVIHDYTVCRRHNARCQEQQMAPLPAERITPSRPFTFTGVDYAGPFSIKKSPGRGSRAYKGYIAIFICLSVKAIHLELVSDLTTAAFMAALHRFCSRRGRPNIIFSDNGTNFHGAASEIRRLFKPNSALCQEVMSRVAREEITWKFIPPRAPHFGGLWEGNIRSVKRHLTRSLGETLLTFEEFSTLLSRIEACLNSRPLSPISSDGNDLNALTPGHFLIGDSLLAIPCDASFSTISRPINDRWTVIKQMTSQFWNRWKVEYLCHLQRRVKWLKPHQELKIGDLVIIRNLPLPPTQWALGRILNLHPGKDGLNRVATVKTSSRELVRPIHQLILLLSAADPVISHPDLRES